MITTCFPGQDGKLIDVLAPGIAATLNGATDSLSSVSDFNSTEFVSLINTPFTQMGTSLNNQLNNIALDLDNTNLDVLKKLADKNQYAACTDPKFAADSWIPSTNAAQTAVPCQISGGAAVTSCTGGDFTAASNGCAGCMDTYALFIPGNTTTGNVQTAINGRYTVGTCTTFATELGNTWENYYMTKHTAINAAKGRYDGAATTAMGNVQTDLGTNIPNTFDSVTSQLNSIAPTITDPQYGLIVGLNCLLIGEDMIRVVDVLCSEAFNQFYFLRLILGIASFGILFAMCCAVCAGVRHYKHSEMVGQMRVGDLEEDGSMDHLKGNRGQSGAKLYEKY